MIERVKEKVFELMGADKSGHGAEHIRRVTRLAEEFARGEALDREVLILIALLHDADDYKLFGAENGESLSNARRIMRECNVPRETAERVLSEISAMGYSKALQGIFPQSREGKTVSDADMCDALGANGILRTHAFSLAKNRPFFEGDISVPENISHEEYIRGNSSGVAHFFEKILRLKSYMHTDAGRKEAEIRHRATIDFLKELFREENAQNLQQLLREYL